MMSQRPRDTDAAASRDGQPVVSIFTIEIFFFFLKLVSKELYVLF